MVARDELAADVGVPVRVKAPPALGEALLLGFEVDGLQAADQGWAASNAGGETGFEELR